MSNETPTVSFSADDALNIANALAAAASVIDPKIAGAVAAATGIAALIRDTIVPAIQHLTADQISVAEQALLAAESAAERVKVGAPPAEFN